MKILYGVCGDGFGHSSRSKEIISYLQKKGHKVLVFTHDRAVPVLKEAGFNVKEIAGLELIFKNNKLSIGGTTLNSISKIFLNMRNFYKIKKIVEDFSPEICISDMETFVPFIAFLYRLPLISIDNQHMISQAKIKIPEGNKKDFYMTRMGINACITKADAFIILSFTKKRTKKKNTYIVNPVIKKEIIKLKPRIKDKILVYYQSKPDKDFINVLKSIPEQFVVYIYGENTNKKEGNVEFKKMHDNFIENLRDCKAVIGTSGFTLISEALFLKKPYFAIPLNGTFEQKLNAIFIKESGYGSYSEKPSKNQIEHFVKRLDSYRKKIKKHKMNPKEVFKTLDKVLKKVKREYYI